jgi:hypothetical protein
VAHGTWICNFAADPAVNGWAILCRAYGGWREVRFAPLGATITGHLPNFANRIDKRAYPESIRGKSDMSEESYTIVKSYKIFAGGPTGEPTDLESEFDMQDWLIARGYTASAAKDIIRKIDLSGRMVVTVP